MAIQKPKFLELSPGTITSAPSGPFATATLTKSWPVVGELRLVACDSGLLRIDFVDLTPAPNRDSETPPTASPNARRIIDQAVAWLDTYVESGRAEAFPPLALKGTAFQKTVWAALAGLAAGCTVTYRELGERVGKPNAARCIGGAVGRNPLPVMVPCHRVLASGGQLGGFSGGMWRKRALLGLEKIGYRDVDGVWVDGGPRDLRLTA